MASVDGENSQVQIVYARPSKQISIFVDYRPGMTLEEAIKRSGILVRCLDIDLANNKVGVFGRIEALDALLTIGDRVEIYRPLQIDPKQARRDRTRQK